MQQITKMQYWQIQEEIKQNRHLSLVGSLNYSADVKKATYYKENKVYLKHDKSGYFADPIMLGLLPK